MKGTYKVPFLLPKNMWLLAISTVLLARADSKINRENQNQRITP